MENKEERTKTVVLNYLKELFPGGHEDFIPLTIEEMELHSDKNHDYAFGGNALGNFKRVSTILGLYDGLKLDKEVVVALVYMMKQLDAVFWMLAKGNTAKVEGLESRLKDISVYAKIAILILKEKSRETDC